MDLKCSEKILVGIIYDFNADTFILKSIIYKFFPAREKKVDNLKMVCQTSPMGCVHTTTTFFKNSNLGAIFVTFWFKNAWIQIYYDPIC